MPAPWLSLTLRRLRSSASTDADDLGWAVPSWSHNHLDPSFPPGRRRFSNLTGTSSPKGHTRAPRWAPDVPTRGTATGVEYLEGEMRGAGDTRMAARQVLIKLQLYFLNCSLYIIEAWERGRACLRYCSADAIKKNPRGPITGRGPVTGSYKIREGG